MVVETKDRPVGRPRVRRATTLAGMLLAFGAVAGCGSGGTGVAGGAPGTVALPSASPSVSPAAAPSATPAPNPAPTGQTGQAGPTAGATTQNGGPTMTPVPGTGPGGPGIAPGEPAPVPGGLQTVSYRADGDRLTVWFYGGVCEKYGLKADESRTGQVGIRFVTTATTAPGRTCPAVAEQQSATVDLAKPLMGRAVVDTARGAEVPLEADPHVAPTEPSQR